MIAPGSLTIPVVGARPEQLRDTYSESRAEGRTHNALDIMAKCDTQIVAATAGQDRQVIPKRARRRHDLSNGG